MKQRHKIIALITVMLLFVLSCATLITVTIAKFVSEQNAPWGKDQTVDFTMENVYEVNNQDELFSALNNGYPFIRLSKDIDNPLIITDDAENLYQDLILDLNGIEIQRNGHDPILNILPGVRLTVTDTSEEQTGGLYNPVGSVFNIAGGTLTVASGGFESGPRYSEYYSYNSYILDNSTNSETKRTLVSGAENVAYYTKSGGEFVKSNCVAPIIQSYPTTTNEIIYNHGNLYFDTAMTKFAGTTLTHAINADTYCYYYTQDKSSYRTSIPKDADWYYSYYVTTATNKYFAVELTEDQKASELYTQVIIYGYEGVIKDASKKTQQKDYYAAVKMQEGMGKLDVQKGKFFCYFGVNTTAAVNAMGGIITVKSGEFSSRVPNATSATQNSVNAREDDHLAFTDNNYFNNFKWANNTFASGAQARKGESYCILNGGNAQVTITKGKFYSSNNNTISMSGGELTTSGTFTKNNTVKLDERGDAATKFAAVYMNNGTLNVSDSTFNVYGDYTAGVYIKAGTIDIAKSECNVKGANTNGIYSLVEGEGNFTVTDTNFTMTDGDSQMGIYAENGEVSLRSTSTSTFNIAGANSKAVYAAAGSTIKSEGYTYTLSGAQSEGIHSTGGKVEVNDGSINLTKISSAGIYSMGGEVVATGVQFTLNGEGSVGIYATGGTITAQNSNITLTNAVGSYGIFAASATNTLITVNVDNATIKAGGDTQNAKSGTVRAAVGVFLMSANPYSQVRLNKAQIYANDIGIAVNGGQLNATGGGSITSYNGSAIAVEGGNVTFDSTEKFTVASTINRNESDSTEHAYEIQLQKVTESGYNSVAYGNIDGIYVSGGTIRCNSPLDYTFVGLQNDTSYTYYTNEKINSHAVAVSSGDFIATGENSKLKVVAKTGGGILVEGGNVKIGRVGANDEDFAVYAQSLNYDGTYTKGNKNTHTLTATGSTVATWRNWHNLCGGHAVEVNSGDLIIYSGYYEAYYGNGLSVYSDDTNSNVSVYGGTFNGWMDGKHSGDTSFTSAVPYLDGSRLCGPAAYCGLRVIGAVTVDIYGGNFDGGNGGASISGRLSPGSTDCKTANVNLYAGIFGNSDTPVSQDGICLYEGSNVIFGAYGSEAYAAATNKTLRVNSLGCAIAYSPMNSYSDTRWQTVAAGTASVYYGYYYAKNGDTGMANSPIFNVYNKASSPTYVTSNVTKGTYANVNNALPLFYPWTGSSGTSVVAKLAENENSTITYDVVSNAYFIFDYEVVGTGSLTISYTSAADDTVKSVTRTAGVYTDAKLYLKAGTKLTLTYNAVDGSTTTKGYFCKIYNYRFVAVKYNQTASYSGAFTDGTMSNTGSDSDVVVDGTTYNQYKQYTGSYLTYDMYNTDFWSGTNWLQGKIYSRHNESNAIPAMIKITANSDKVDYNGKLGIWNEKDGQRVTI